MSARGSRLATVLPLTSALVLFSTSSPLAQEVEDHREEPEPEEPTFQESTILSVEAVTHVPVDVGIQVGYEAPFGLRIFGGYGWIPSGYIHVVTGVAARAIDDPRSKTVLANGHYSGNIWRIQGGIRPFSKLGLYLDGGYAHANVDGSIELAESGVPELAVMSGGYEASLTLDMWLVELGYQAQIAKRIVLGLGLGAMGTIDARTTAEPTGGAPGSSAIPQTTEVIDQAIEEYGILPTLTLRLGVDLI